jgi:hypothetical protein
MSNGTTLKNHIALHVAKQIGAQCEKCNKTFASKTVLRGHQFTTECGNDNFSAEAEK